MFVTSPDGVSGQNFAMGAGQTKSFDNQPSNDGIYSFGFRVYAPTKNAYSKAWGAFRTNYLTFDSTDTIRTTNSQPIANSTIDFKFNPLYYTEFGGDLKSGMTEGIKQDSTLDIKKSTSSVDGSNRVARVEYGGTDSSKFKMYGGTNVAMAVRSGNQITSIEDVLNPPSFPVSTNGFYTFLAQNL